MLKIGLIDSHSIMRISLAVLSKKLFESVEILESDNIKQFSQIHSDKTPDLVLFGNNSNLRKNCLHEAMQLKRAFPKTPLIIYDDHIDYNLTIPYFKIGISGYFLKRNNISIMEQCISYVLGQEKYVSPTLLKNLLENISKVSHKTSPPSSLTGRESQIAAYLTEGMTTSYIAKKLDRKPSTISTIKHNIYKKLKVKNAFELKNLFETQEIIDPLVTGS